jgi:hypothetical protein
LPAHGLDGEYVADKLRHLLGGQVLAGLHLGHGSLGGKVHLFLRLEPSTEAREDVGPAGRLEERIKHQRQHVGEDVARDVDRANVVVDQLAVRVAEPSVLGDRLSGREIEPEVVESERVDVARGAKLHAAANRGGLTAHVRREGVTQGLVLRVERNIQHRQQPPARREPKGDRAVQRQRGPPEIERLVAEVPGQREIRAAGQRVLLADEIEPRVLQAADDVFEDPRLSRVGDDRDNRHAQRQSSESSHEKPPWVTGTSVTFRYRAGRPWIP